MVLEMMMESLFAVVDAYFVGKVSTEAVAAVGLTEAVTTLVYSVGIGLAAAATAMVARRIGEKDPEAASKAAAQSILIAVFIGAVIGVLGFTYGEGILRLMGGSEEVIQAGSGYTRIILGTNLVIILLFLLNGVFRGAGDASLAMRSLWLANGLNIVLDPIFIFGLGPIPAMGAEGAAIATSIGRGIGVLYQLWMLFGKQSIIKLKKAY
ncbi:MAG: MATE family efflux transporter, partial [Saprospiraceae bacterium]|nr:MATE family efflux transporter [Saprospiraceae bacterium]